MVNERFAAFGILFVVVLSAFFVAVGSFTGQVANNAYYGPKIYGGAMKLPTYPGVVNREFSRQSSMKATSDYMFEHIDEWECGQSGVEDSSRVCMYVESVQSFCCIPGYLDGR